MPQYTTKLKPIAFKDPLVRAIGVGTKTMTRRKITPTPKQYCAMTAAGLITSDKPIIISDDGLVLADYGECTTWDEMPYRPGDILYVREAYYKDAGRYVYKADMRPGENIMVVNGREIKIRWRPPFLMPREAARTFLRVTKVKVQRLQDMSDADMANDFDLCLEAIQTVGRDTLAKSVWDSTVKEEELNINGWDANPWVYVIYYEVVTGPMQQVLTAMVRKLTSCTITQQTINDFMQAGVR